MFVQQIGQTYNNENIKAPHYLPFFWDASVFPHKRPMVRKTFVYDNAIMRCFELFYTWNPKWASAEVRITVGKQLWIARPYSGMQNQILSDLNQGQSQYKDAVLPVKGISIIPLWWKYLFLKDFIDIETLPWKCFDAYMYITAWNNGPANFLGSRFVWWYFGVTVNRSCLAGTRNTYAWNVDTTHRPSQTPGQRGGQLLTVELHVHPKPY